MEISSKRKKRMRSKIGRITTVIAVGFVLCSFAPGSAHAADKGGHDTRGGGGARHSDNRGGGDRGHAVYAQPGNYYAPPANYYAAPEPYYYDDAPQPPPEGINLFFGL
jgi:hypothetical protein